MSLTRWWLALWWPEPQDLLPWINILAQYTPQVYVRNEKSLVCEIGRSRHLIDKDSLLSQMGAMEGPSPFQWAEASSPAEALALAHYSKKDVRALPLDALVYFLDPFSEVSQDLKPLKKIIADLRSLGLNHLGAFMDLTEKEIGMRWSHWGKRLWMNVHGFLPQQEPILLQNENFSESYDFPDDSNETLLESLYFIAKQLLHRLQKRLSQRALGAQSLRVILTGSNYEQDFCGSLEFELRLPAFHNDVALWLLLLRERLQGLARQQKLPALMERLEIVIDETISWQGVQKNLFDPQREQREGSLLETIVKIESRIGAQRVFCAEPRESYRPEKSWQRGSTQTWLKVISGSALRSTKSENATLQVYDLLSQKPLRVFASPQKLEWREQKILLNNKWLRCRVTWSEIISGEFWSNPFERRYGFGYLESGERLWIYKEGDHLYLQGMFV